MKIPKRLKKVYKNYRKTFQPRIRYVYKQGFNFGEKASMFSLKISLYLMRKREKKS